MRSWKELMPVAGPAADNIKWKLTWSEWRVAQGQTPALSRHAEEPPADAEDASPTPFNETVLRRLAFVRWLYETGRLVP